MPMIGFLYHKIQNKSLLLSKESRSE